MTDPTPSNGRVARQAGADPVPVDRRRLLQRLGLAAAAGGTASVLAPMITTSQSANAATNAPVLLGQSNTASTFTEITNSDRSASGLWVVGEARSQFSYTAAIVGDSDSLPGVVGTSTDDIGVLGMSASTDGVFGYCSGGGVGVRGVSYSPDAVPAGSGTGVVGYGPTGGVYGETHTGSGVEGVSETGTGLKGSATHAGGTGVAASAVAGGTALSVSGVAHFSRSGTTTIAAGHLSVVVSGVALGGTSLALATVQQTATGNAISSAVPNPSTSSITISLAKAAATNTRIAWFVVN